MTDYFTADLHLGHAPNAHDSPSQPSTQTPTNYAALLVMPWSSPESSPTTPASRRGTPARNTTVMGGQGYGSEFRRTSNEPRR